MPTSSDGFITALADNTRKGVLMRCDVAAAAHNVTFQRVDPDGTVHTVRSGDNVGTAGGTVAAYDYEMPLGVPVQYRVVTSLGVTSTTATVTVTGLTAGAMLKSIRNPSLSVVLPVVAFDEQYAADLDLATVVGSRYPAATDRGMFALTGSLAMRATSKANHDALHQLLRTPGPYLLQSRDVHGIPADLWLIRTSLDVLRIVPTRWTNRVEQIGIQEVERPTTVGWPMLMPGWSWADAAATYATGTAMKTANATWWDLLLRGIS